MAGTFHSLSILLLTDPYLVARIFSIMEKAATTNCTQGFLSLESILRNKIAVLTGPLKNHLRLFQRVPTIVGPANHAREHYPLFSF